MGKVASTAVSAVGTIGGLFSKGFFKGSFNWWGLGLMAASALLSKGSQGQRLNDLGVTTAQEGAEIIKVFGTARHGLNLVWSSGLIEHKKGGGKGAPESSEFTYTTSLFYVGGIGSIDYLKRLKLNNKVFYNRNADGDEQGFLLSTSGDGTYFYGEAKDGTKLRVYRGTLDQPVDSMLEAKKGVGQWTNYPGLWCIAIEDLPLDDYNNSVPNLSAWPYNATRDLPSVIEWIGAQVGYVAGDFDLSALDGELVSENADEGFIVSSRRSAASYIKELETAHYFKLVPVDGVLRAVKDGGAPVVRIPLSDQRVRVLAAGSGNSGNGDGALGTPAKHDDAQARPYIQEIAFYDVSRENNVGYRPYALPTDAQQGDTGNDSRRKETLSLNFACGGSRMMKLAKILALRRRIEADWFAPQLGFKYRWLAPGDVVTLETCQGAPLSGTREDVDVWMQSLRLGQPGLLGAVTPRSDRLIYDITAPPDTAGLPTPVVPTDEPVFFYSQTNALLDAQNAELGFYLAWGRNFNGRSQHTSFSADGIRHSGEFSLGSSVSVPESTIGNTVGTLADFDNGNSRIFDDVTTLTIDFATGQDLQSRSDAELFSGKNALIVGKELLQFGTATYIGVQSDGRKRWTVTHLLRGRRGTEYWMGQHTGSEQVCVVDHGLGFVAFDASLLAQEVPATVNFKHADDLTLGITLQGNTFKPYSPATILSERNSALDVSVSFEPRSRYGYSFGISSGDNTGETLTSGQHKYEMDVLNGSGDVLTTYYSDVASFSIPAADQVTFFGSTQSAISVVLYQNSGIVGRGYPAPATV